jgi:hypothetical protein
VNVADRALHVEVRAARVLEGRAVQDVWIMPRSDKRRSDSDRTMDMYGTVAHVGRCDRVVAHRVDEPGPWAPRGTNRPVERTGHSSGRYPP